MATLGRIMCGAALSLGMMLGCLVACSGPRDEDANWALVRSDPASDAIDILVGFGACSTYLRTDVAEHTEDVRIRVVVHTTSDNCKANEITKQMTMSLGSVLGTRKIVGECAGPAGPECPSLKASVAAAHK